VRNADDHVHGSRAGKLDSSQIAVAGKAVVSWRDLVESALAPGSTSFVVKSSGTELVAAVDLIFGAKAGIESWGGSVESY